jgi:hypothetical protein
MRDGFLLESDGMALHDWSRVDAGTFHNFHLLWTADLCNRLNAGLLPESCYAMAEQHTGPYSPDAIALRTRSADGTSQGDVTELDLHGTTAVATTAPRVKFVAELEDVGYSARRRTIVIRHASGNRILALLEILSPGNKSSEYSFEQFIDKVATFLMQGYHVLVVDLHRSGNFDPTGVHGALWRELGGKPYEPPDGKTRTLGSYTGWPQITAYVEPLAIGDPLVTMPLFIEQTHYVNVPLAESYDQVFAALPKQVREMLTSRLNP